MGRAPARTRISWLSGQGAEAFGPNSWCWLSKSNGACSTHWAKLPRMSSPGPNRVRCCQTEEVKEGMTSGVYPYPSPHPNPKGRTITEHVPCLELCWDRTVTKTVPALHSQGSVPRQAWDRGAQKSFALQNPRAEPRPSKEEAPGGNTALSGLLIIVGRDGRGSQDPKPGKGGSYRSRNETEEEERGWRPELGGWTPLTSSTSSCDTPCCWGDRELGHLSQSRKADQ